MADILTRLNRVVPVGTGHDAVFLDLLTVLEALDSKHNVIVSTLLAKSGPLSSVALNAFIRRASNTGDACLIVSDSLNINHF